MKQVQRVYHFVVSGFGMVLIGPIWLGIYQCSYFLPLLLPIKNRSNMEDGSCNGISLRKRILHIFYTLY
jgi:hypothetical protein